MYYILFLKNKRHTLKVVLSIYFFHPTSAQDLLEFHGRLNGHEVALFAQSQAALNREVPDHAAFQKVCPSTLTAFRLLNVWGPEIANAS